jgi:hypothetical protein
MQSTPKFHWDLSLPGRMQLPFYAAPEGRIVIPND